MSTTLGMDEMGRSLNETVDGVESVRVQVLRALRFVHGEWFLNRHLGTIYLGLRSDDLPLQNAVMQRAVLSVDDVQAITHFDGRYYAHADETRGINARSYVVDLAYQTDFGIVNQRIVYQDELTKPFFTADAQGNYFTANLGSGIYFTGG